MSSTPVAAMTTLSVMATDNKQLIQEALAKLMHTGDESALEPFLHAGFVHHRPDSTSNKGQWLAAVRALPLADLRVVVRHLLADGAYVVMHSTRSLASGGPEIAGVDIWRMEDGLIAEGWEILEPVAEAAQHFMWWKAGPTHSG
jgi:predicted SnoaL-like aldol condensation-catalyzing enzyme